MVLLRIYVYTGYESRGQQQGVFLQNVFPADSADGFSFRRGERGMGEFFDLFITFARIGGVNMVWWAFPCAEVAAMTMSILYTKRIRKNIIEKMTPRPAQETAEDSL